METEVEEPQTTCLLNNIPVLLPRELLMNEFVFKDVVSCNTWDGLDETEKAHLRTFLPRYQWNTTKHQEDTVRMLLTDSGSFKTDPPRREMLRRCKTGRLDPVISKQWEECQKAKYEAYKVSQRIYLQRMLEKLVVLRQSTLDDVQRFGPNTPRKRKITATKTSSLAAQRAQRRYKEIIKDVKSTTKDASLSSDEDIGDSASSDLLKGRTPLNDADYASLLRKHKSNKVQHKMHPDFDTSGISLTDVITRVNPKQNSGLKKHKMKGKLKKEKRDKKVLKAKRKSKLTKAATAGVRKDTVLPINMNELDGEMTEHGSQPTVAGSEDAIEDVTLPSIGGAEEAQSVEPTKQFSCFFAVVRSLFKEAESWSENQIELEKKLFAWECTSPTDLPWFMAQINWTDLLNSALNYLSGEGKATLLNDFVPMVILDGDANEWKWTGADHDDDAILQPLCDYWLDTLRHGNIDNDPMDSEPRTSYIVRPSTGDEKISFREQEHLRYENPHLPFLYSMHGFQSIVGPVKGVFHKDAGVSKAREHALLTSNRPAYVTILSLVRDAVARLPNGEGTRAEVCEMLKDSQFLNPKSTDAQIHGVVSGALDRLHAEKDPCVKYDITRKVWIYLHKTRSIEQFELLHHACAAASMAKKQLHQKQKSFKQKKALQELVQLQEKDGSALPLRKRKHPKKVRSLPSAVAPNAAVTSQEMQSPRSTSTQPGKATTSTSTAVGPAARSSTQTVKRPANIATKPPVVATSIKVEPVDFAQSGSLEMNPSQAVSPSTSTVASDSSRPVTSSSFPGIKGAKLTIGYLQSLGYGTSKQAVKFDLEKLRTAMEQSRSNPAGNPPPEEQQN